MHDYTFKHCLFIATFLIFLTLIPSPVVYGHGTVIYPPSRIWNCYQENPENPISPPCIEAVATHGTQPLYDWNEVNQPFVDGDHEAFVPDGNLASGGRPDKYGGMDQVRDDWVATPVNPGPITVTWMNTAPHATAYYWVYITTEDWTPDQELSWDELELLADTGPSSASEIVDIPITLPFRSGKHVLYSVWQRSDSPEAFYSASELDFGTVTLPINLLSFTGRAFEDYNQLEWRTASELNTEWHIIQRSTDGVSDWEEVGRTPSVGSSNEEQSYILIDSNPVQKSFYRLLSRDFDGTEQFSNLIHLMRETKHSEQAVIYPNPVNNILTVNLNTHHHGDLTISLYDMSGREVLETSHDTSHHHEHSFSVDLSAVRPGIYILKVFGTEVKPQTIKVLKH